MPSRLSKGRDFVAIARNVAEKAIGEHLDGTLVVLFFFYYNFCRTHSTLRVTPAMEAGLTGNVWSLEERCATLPAQVSATKRIDKGPILKALGEKQASNL